MKRSLCLIISLVTLLSSMVLGGCSRPPEYAEIEGRFRELVEKSYEVNKLLFGEGLETYERIMDPWSNMSVYEKADEDGDGKHDGYVYYCYMQDEKYGEILAYRDGYSKPKQYLQVLSIADGTREAAYIDENAKKYYYVVDYKEPEIDFYYSENDPDNYDYVIYDLGMSIEKIKLQAEEIYSRDYLEKVVYVGLFSGTASEDGLAGLSARYIEYYNSDTGMTSLMMSNKYEPLITETRIFDFATARMVKPSRKNIVTIELESYLESKPDERLSVRVTLVLQNDGQWYLDSGTY